MLYPKASQPLHRDDFTNPGAEYRATPFWAWNAKLSREELLWQIEQFKKMGFGGFHMHVRTGMATEYLSDAYMQLIRACVDKAEREKMLAWLYDEDRWPSGAAGGLLTKDVRYRSRHLLLTQKPYGSDHADFATGGASAASSRTENGVLLACYDVRLNESGLLAGHSRIPEDAPAQGLKLYAYLETAAPSPWYNNQTYVNTLDPAAIAKFIELTYQRYNEAISAQFGGVVPAIFTDEPQFVHKGVLDFATEEKDVVMPWTDDLAETFAQAYPGEDLLCGVPELLWDLPDGRVSVLRYHYHDHVAERFAQAFADQCGAWCEKHGLMLTGHMMEEPTLRSQTAALGDAMRSYRSFQLPGIDMLCDSREFTTAKQAQSAARQYGRPGVLSELYGVTNWNFDFRMQKMQGDWQAALGVTVRVPHLSWYSMNGEAKRDFPGTFGYQAPWYQEYHYVEDHFARVNSILTRGTPVCRVGMLHPVESYWLHWGPRESTSAIREQMDCSFKDIANWLLRGQIDFDYISESLFPSQCDITDILTDALPVGEMRYEVILLPAMQTMRSTTLDRLCAFADKGGRILLVGSEPTLVDAKPDARLDALLAKCERIPLEKHALLTALSGVRDLDIRTGAGEPADGLLYQMREESGEKWLFIAHADAPANIDLPMAEPIRVTLRGEYALELYDTSTGKVRPLPVRYRDGNTVLSHTLYAQDSLLVRMVKAVKSEMALAAEDALPAPSAQGQRFLTPVPITLGEPNVLLIDRMEYALNEAPYRKSEDILRLDNILRDENGWPRRQHNVAQPWVENDTSTPHTLRLRYTFLSEVACTGASLALENAESTRVTLNGQAAQAPDGWYVDKCIGTVKLPSIQRGENTLELSVPYGRKVDVEACYLLGDFGVRVRGLECTLTAPVRTLGFGDITCQGLPFYGGNITYHLMDVAVASDRTFLQASCYRGQLMRVHVDGNDAGVIAYSPYVLALDGLGHGKHAVDITLYGNRINTFGQVHCVERRLGYWWGPRSWRTEGVLWSDEYQLWPQGIMKSPQVIV